MYAIPEDHPPALCDTDILINNLEEATIQSCEPLLAPRLLFQFSSPQDIVAYFEQSHQSSISQILPGTYQNP